jgi:hypothetical protein
VQFLDFMTFHGYSSMNGGQNISEGTAIAYVVAENAADLVHGTSQWDVAWGGARYNCRMSSIVSQPAELAIHPSTSGGAVRSVAAEVRMEEPGILVFRYVLEADLSSLRVPQCRAGGRADGLWEHTCFEAFVTAAEPGYHELNFSPSLDWAVYRFTAYREGMSLPKIGEAPEMSVRRSEGGLELRSAVRLGQLAELQDARLLRVALAAIIEDESGGRSYWSLRHPPGKPDFHHSTGFALEVACP